MEINLFWDSILILVVVTAVVALLFFETPKQWLLKTKIGMALLVTFAVLLALPVALDVVSGWEEVNAPKIDIPGGDGG